MPSIGNCFDNSVTILRLIPASFGVHGPGEITIDLGFNLRILFIEILSFLKTTTF